MPSDERTTNADPIAADAPEQESKTRPLLNASEPLDLDRVETEFSATLEERRTLEADTQRAFRSKERTPTPSAVVQSAEGPMLFPGLHISNNGPLSKAARDALQQNFPADTHCPEKENA